MTKRLIEIIDDQEEDDCWLVTHCGKKEKSSLEERTFENLQRFFVSLTIFLNDSFLLQRIYNWWAWIVSWSIKIKYVRRFCNYAFNFVVCIFNVFYSFLCSHSITFVHFHFSFQFKREAYGSSFISFKVVEELGTI